MFLHTWWQFSLIKGFLSISLDLLLSVILSIQHELIFGNENLIRNNSCTELMVHFSGQAFIEVVFSLFLLVSFIEGEWLFGCFGLGHGGFLVELSSSSFFHQNFLIQWLSCTLGNTISSELLLAMQLLHILFLSDHLINSTCSDALLLLLLVLHKIKWKGHGDIVFTFAAFGYEILFVDELLFETSV